MRPFKPLPRIEGHSAVVQRERTSTKTFVEFADERLSALCAGVEAPVLLADLRPLLTQMLEGWGQRSIGLEPRFRSNIADDEAPYEFAIGLSEGAPEVQFYVEAPGEPPTLESNMHAGRALLERAANTLGASLRRLRVVEDLFFPAAPCGPFTNWTGVSCSPGRRAQLKVYLNPQVAGINEAPRIVDEAMARLGFARAWARVRASLSSTAERRDEIAIFSMDLCDAADARVKVYIRHHNANLTDIRSVASTATDYFPDDVTPFYTTLSGSEGRYLRKPPLTELAFVERDKDRPSSVTLEFPIGSYVATDQVARERISRCLGTFGLEADRYAATIQAFATRPLAERSGIHAHVTLRRIGGRPRLGIYFASEAYAVARRCPE